MGTVPFFGFDTKVGTFTQALYDEAKKNGWVVISMKKDWKKIFAFGQYAWADEPNDVHVPHERRIS